MNRQDYIAGDWVLSTSADYQNRIVQIQDINLHGTIHALDDGNEVILNQGEYEPIPMHEDWLWDWDEERDHRYNNGYHRRFFAPGASCLHPCDVPFYISNYTLDHNFYAYTTSDLLLTLRYVHELQHLLYAVNSKVQIEKPKRK